MLPEKQTRCIEKNRQISGLNGIITTSKETFSIPVIVQVITVGTFGSSPAALKITFRYKCYLEHCVLHNS